MRASTYHNSPSSVTFSQFYDATPRSYFERSLIHLTKELRVNEAKESLTEDIPSSMNQKTFQSFYKKLRNFSRLNKGWDSYDAETPNLLAIAKTRLILEKLEQLNLVPTDVCPSVEGGASIYFIKGNKYADFECFNSGEILAGISNSVDEPSVLEVDLDSVDIAIERIQQILND